MNGAPSLPPEKLIVLRDYVIDLWAQGLTAEEVAEFLGYPKNWIEREIEKHMSRQIAAGLKERKA